MSASSIKVVDNAELTLAARWARAVTKDAAQVIQEEMFNPALKRVRELQRDRALNEPLMQGALYYCNSTRSAALVALSLLHVIYSAGNDTSLSRHTLSPALLGATLTYIYSSLVIEVIVKAAR